jgi:hypothetical protein
MKRHFLFIGIFFFGFIGCASHYYKIRDNTVHIYLRRPDVKVIYFASSLDGYELHEAQTTGGKTWKVEVPADVEFRYFYVIDGVVHLPSCKFREKDDFGSENCIYIPDM